MLKNNFSVLFHKQGRECGTAAHKHLDNAAVHLQGYDFNLYYELNKDTKVAQGFSFALIWLRVSQTKCHSCDSNWQENAVSKLTGKKISCPNWIQISICIIFSFLETGSFPNMVHTQQNWLFISSAASSSKTEIDTNCAALPQAAPTLRCSWG